jgi:hypothetical protein
LSCFERRERDGIPKKYKAEQQKPANWWLFFCRWKKNYSSLGNFRKEWEKCRLGMEETRRGTFNLNCGKFMHLMDKRSSDTNQKYFGNLINCRKNLNLHFVTFNRRIEPSHLSLNILNDAHSRFRARPRPGLEYLSIFWAWKLELVSVLP